jgi:hypothetical protein
VVIRLLWRKNRQLLYWNNNNTSSSYLGRLAPLPVHDGWMRGISRGACGLGKLEATSRWPGVEFPSTHHLLPPRLVPVCAAETSGLPLLCFALLFALCCYCHCYFCNHSTLSPLPSSHSFRTYPVLTIINARLVLSEVNAAYYHLPTTQGAPELPGLTNFPTAPGHRATHPSSVCLPVIIPLLLPPHSTLGLEGHDRPSSWRPRRTPSRTSSPFLLTARATPA